MYDAQESAFFQVIDAVPNQLRVAAMRTPLLRTSIGSVSTDGSVVSGQSVLFDAPDASITTEGDEVFRWTSATGTVGLGFLPECDRNDPFVSQSQPGPMSADGSILLGSCRATVGNTTTNPLFRWTQSSGLMRIDAPPGLSAARWAAMSTDGTVAGGSAEPAPGESMLPHQVFRWTQTGGAVGLGTLPGADSSDLYGGMTADGKTIVGLSGHEIFRWTEATGMVALPTPAGFDHCEPVLRHGYVDVALVAGRCESATDSQFFLWTGISAPKAVALPPGALADGDPGVLADGTVVVGTFRDAVQKTRGFRWTEATGPIELSLDGYGGCSVTSGVDLGRSASANGKVVIGDCGRLLDGGAVARTAFRWTEASSIAPFSPLPGDDGTLSTSVSEDGTVITGASIHTPDPTHVVTVGVLWDESGKPTSMVEHLTTSGLDLHGFQITVVMVSRVDKHLFSGTGTTSDGQLRSWIARLP